MRVETYKLNKLSKSSKKILASISRDITRYYNDLLDIALDYANNTSITKLVNTYDKKTKTSIQTSITTRGKTIDRTSLTNKYDSLLGNNQLRSQVISGHQLTPSKPASYISEAIIDRVLTITKRYTSNNIGKPRFKNIRKARYSIPFKIYSTIEASIIQEEGTSSKLIRLPGTKKSTSNKADLLVRVRTNNRTLEGDIKALSLKRDACGDYWLLVTTNFTSPYLVNNNPPLTSLGVDLGLRDYAIASGLDSNGSIVTIPHPRSKQDITREFNKLENASRLKYIKHKTSSSTGFNGDTRGIKHIHRRIERKRKDCNHKYARVLLDTASTILVGNVSNNFLLSNTSKNARKASDACHCYFKLILGEKASRATSPRIVNLVNESYTSKTCFHCKTINNIKDSKQWTCTSCGKYWDRDINASLNISIETRIVKDLVIEHIEARDNYDKLVKTRQKARNVASKKINITSVNTSEEASFDAIKEGHDECLSSSPGL